MKASRFEFRRHLVYKAAMRGGQVEVADRFYDSSKTCSACNEKPGVLPLSVREWTCAACGEVQDRELNAAGYLYVAGESGQGNNATVPDCWKELQ